MAGLTEKGVRERIRRHQYELTESEAVDLFFIFPNLVNIKREKGYPKFVTIDGLNLKFSINN